MDDFLFALNTVLPLLLLMSLGWFCRRIGLLTEKLVTGVNQLVFKLFLPVNLCVSVMNTPYDTTISLGAFLLVVIGLAAEFGVLFLLIPRIEKDKKKIGVMIQGMARSNYAFFGIPLVAMLFPGQDTSLASLMVIATIPVYNILSVVALCVYGEGEVKLGRVLLNILKNPLIIGTAIGYLFWALRFQPPGVYQNHHVRSGEGRHAAGAVHPGRGDSILQCEGAYEATADRGALEAGAVSAGVSRNRRFDRRAGRGAFLRVCRVRRADGGSLLSYGPADGRRWGTGR